MEGKKTYECTVSMCCDATDPADAANRFIANIQDNPNWYVRVREMRPDGSLLEKFVTVDTETGETEP